MVFFFFTGWLDMNLHQSKSYYEWSNERCLFTGVVKDAPREKAKSYSCEVLVKALSDSQKTVVVNRKLQLYLKKDADSRNLKIGDEIKFLTSLKKIPHTQTLTGFDYADYMKKKGITVSCYVDEAEWYRTGKNELGIIERQLLSIKQYILSEYALFFGSTREKSVLEALTVGYKEDLTKEQKKMFSEVGASHLLALSGLHLGILCALLDLLFFFLWSYRARKVKNVLILLFIWTFAALVGFSVSIVRSAVMLSLFYTARIFDREHSSINTLAWAAFFIVLLNPVAAFDVGFQLSFGAVLGILFFYPQFKICWNPANRVVRYFWGVFGVSMSAQLGVLPIVLYTFSSFPIYFLITNIVAIPLVALILWMAILFLVTTPIFYIHKLLAFLLSFLLILLDKSFSSIAILPYSSIAVDINLEEALIVALFISLFAVLLRTRKLKWGIACMVVASLFLTERTYSFSSYSSSPSIYFGITDNNNNNYIGFSTLRGNQILYNVETHRVNGELINKEGIVRFKNKTLCILSDGRWKKKNSTNPLSIDYLYVSRNYKGNLQDLLSLFRVKQIILDSSLSDYRERKYKDECSQLKIPFILLSEKGNYKVAL